MFHMCVGWWSGFPNEGNEGNICMRRLLVGGVCVSCVCGWMDGEVDVLHIWTNDTDTHVYGRTIHKHLIGGARPGGDAAEGAGAGRRRRGGADGEEIERSDG